MASTVHVDRAEQQPAVPLVGPLEAAARQRLGVLDGDDLRAGGPLRGGQLGDGRVDVGREPAVDGLVRVRRVEVVFRAGVEGDDRDGPRRRVGRQEDVLVDRQVVAAGRGQAGAATDRHGRQRHAGGRGLHELEGDDAARLQERPREAELGAQGGQGGTAGGGDEQAVERGRGGGPGARVLECADLKHAAQRGPGDDVDPVAEQGLGQRDLLRQDAGERLGDEAAVGDPERRRARARGDRCVDGEGVVHVRR